MSAYSILSKLLDDFKACTQQIVRYSQVIWHSWFEYKTLKCPCTRVFMFSVYEESRNLLCYSKTPSDRYTNIMFSSGSFPMSGVCQSHKPELFAWHTSFVFLWAVIVMESTTNTLFHSNHVLLMVSLSRLCYSNIQILQTASTLLKGCRDKVMCYMFKGRRCYP